MIILLFIAFSILLFLLGAYAEIKLLYWMEVLHGEK